MDTATIITIILGILGFLFVVFQGVRMHKLNKENQKLQKMMLDHHLNKDAKEEEEKKRQESEKRKRKKTELDTYCDHIYQKFKCLDFTGLNAILQKPLLLEKIYVKLRARPSYRLTQYKTIADFKKLDEEKVKETDEEFDTVFCRIHQLAVQNRGPLKMVILGHPGSGKTTLMKWIALQCVCSDNSIFSDFIPVFIALKDLGREPDKTFKNKNIQDLTLEMLKKESLPTSFFVDYYEENKIIFLLDGLDEVADESIRREVITWIDNQNIRKNALLVTSRFSGLKEAKGLKFHDAIPVFSIQDFDIDDIESFLLNWYKNIEVSVIGDGCNEDIKKAIEKGKSRYEDLMNIIKNNKYKTLRLLAVNPLLLTIIAIVHRTRAILPKERHKMYEECLKVMIELWNVANKKLDVSFSVDNSISNISKIAVFLMKSNQRELKMIELIDLLPQKIENHSLEYFLKEMVLKAGLLYESEGKYGFLHLTFQEYLTAWYFAQGETPHDILKYRDKDYWIETYKLFVNIGNTRQFFNEIINNLLEKYYWKQMALWDECLEDIVVEDTQKEIEIKFAERILGILPNIEYKEEEEGLIIQLYAHYSLYKHADKFVEQGWNLFHHARHPFVQSVGSSILCRCDTDTKKKLMYALKNRIKEFEELVDKSPAQLLDFVYQNNNAFVLLIECRRNLLDFHFCLEKRKKRDGFIVYLVISNIVNISYKLPLFNIRELLDLREIENLLDLHDLRNIVDLRDIIRHLNLREVINLRDILALRDIWNQYIEKYARLIEANKTKIEAWMDRVIEKLRSLSNEELIDYFPLTSNDDLAVFREEKIDTPVDD